MQKLNIKQKCKGRSWAKCEKRCVKTRELNWWSCCSVKISANSLSSRVRLSLIPSLPLEVSLLLKVSRLRTVYLLIHACHLVQASEHFFLLSTSWCSRRCAPLTSRRGLLPQQIVPSSF